MGPLTVTGDETETGGGSTLALGGCTGVEGAGTAGVSNLGISEG